ncbi:ABATE domain-containing protein [Mesorhizobium yinganensis]|uniref:ABATE domain-containing protein n=1 Tax=Mesorhizobium yinganensis TaxID=3157707 RepID=UPI0032B82CE3
MPNVIVGRDLLANYFDLIARSERTQLIDPAVVDDLRRAASRHPQAAEAALDRAKTFREALFCVLQSEAAGSEPPEHERELFRASVAKALTQRTLVWRAQNGRGIGWRSSELDTVLHRVAWEYGTARYLSADGAFSVPFEIRNKYSLSEKSNRPQFEKFIASHPAWRQVHSYVKSDDFVFSVSWAYQ